MSARTMLSFRAGGGVYALPIAHVGETMRPLPIEKQPNAAPFVLGLAIVRGAPTPVVDATQLLVPGATSHASRWITLRLGERTAMLAVDAVLGTNVVDEATMPRMPPLIGTLAAELVRAVGVLDRSLLIVLEATVLVPASAWEIRT